MADQPQYLFAGRSASGSLVTEYLRYLGLMLGGGAVNLAVYSLLAWTLPKAHCG